MTLARVILQVKPFTKFFLVIAQNQGREFGELPYHLVERNFAVENGIGDREVRNNDVYAIVAGEHIDVVRV